MKIPVLTYHATNIAGQDYHNNDHIAFEQDLALINELNVEVISAHQLVAWLLGQHALDPQKKYVVLTFDDGSDLDFIDWQHPAFGHQSAFYTLMKKHPAPMHATSFVIASPEVRKALIETCLAGHDIWGDHWWQDAEDSGLLSIENHSWDHVHLTLPKVLQKDNIKGDFSVIDTDWEASAQIQQASDYIHRALKNKQVRLFAYPYGQYNDYLVKDYFPDKQDDICGAFTCENAYVTSASNALMIPRFVCGLHWNRSDQLATILSGGYQA